jgi:hypothetical protein
MGVWRVLILAAVFAGCGAEADAKTLSGPVTYGKSGGIAGIIQKLTVQKDGRAVASSYQSKRSFKLSKTQLKGLTTAVGNAKLSKTKSPKDNVQGADGFGYGVSYRGYRVTWSDFSDEPPKRVMTLYRMLDELYEANSPCPRDGRSC